MAVSKKEQIHIIGATIAGGIIEWYELFLYVYWAPVLSKIFFRNESNSEALIKTLFVFAVGFLARPVGGLLFGHMGDRYGRKIAFTRSILFMILPSFTIALLPSGIGIVAPIILCILRFFQGLPAGGELPGAMCYLAECANKNRRSFICSFVFLGPQLGVLISMLECYFLDKYVSPEILELWGWRFSFMLGGFFGLLGFYIRNQLHESPSFHRLELHKKVLHKPILEVIFRHKKEVLFGFVISVFNVVGFYMFSVFLGIYFNDIISLGDLGNLEVSILTMLLSTITLPFFGFLGDKYGVTRLLTISACGTALVICPFYFSVAMSSGFFIGFFEFILLAFLNVQFAVLPCFVAELFPTSTRYTGIGMSFNLCDSLIGGVIPILAVVMSGLIGDVKTFVYFIGISSIITLIALLFFRARQLHEIKN